MSTTAVPHRLHFIGIGGAGMSALARYAAAKGHLVSGSDRRASAAAELEPDGIRVYGSHDPLQLEGAELVVSSSAIPESNPVLAAAHQRGLEVILRGELLARFVRSHPNGVAVCGTHGKGTTAGALVSMLEAPVSYVLGAKLRATERATEHHDGSRFLVAEVDESDRTHLLHRPNHLLINNVEPDHLDTYGTFEAVLEAFEGLVRHFFEAHSQSPHGGPGRFVLGLNESGSRALFERVGGLGAVVTCGFDVGDIQGRALTALPDGRVQFELWRHGEHLGELETGLKGALNARNVLSAAALALELGVDFLAVQRAARAYEGLVDRFQEVEVNGRVLITDYTSHPTSIEGNLASLRARHFEEVHAVFQPFRYSLLSFLWADYLRALSGADVVYLAPMDPGGEAPVPGISGEDLAVALREAGVRVVSSPSIDAIETQLRTLSAGTVAIVFGGGALFDMARRVCEHHTANRR